MPSSKIEAIPVLTDLEANSGSRSSVESTVSLRPVPVDGSILGLYAFGYSCALVSLYNCNASGVTIPNVIVGAALGIGGLGQLIAGIFEMIRGSTYTGTLFLVFTGFWASYAAILLPGTGIIAAFSDQPEMLGDALGIYLAMFCFVSALFLLVGLRKNIALIVTLTLLSITFAMLSAANFTGSPSILMAGGAFGVLTAGGAFYIGTGAFLASEANPVFMLPMGIL